MPGTSPAPMERKVLVRFGGDGRSPRSGKPWQAPRADQGGEDPQMRKSQLLGVHVSLYSAIYARSFQQKFLYQVPLGIYKNIMVKQHGETATCNANVAHERKNYFRWSVDGSWSKITPSNVWCVAGTKKHSKNQPNLSALSIAP